MGSVSVFVGLDYNQDSVRVEVMDGEGRSFANADLPNDAEAIDACVRRFGEPVGAVEPAAGPRGSRTNSSASAGRSPWPTRACAVA